MYMYIYRFSISIAIRRFIIIYILTERYREYVYNIYNSAGMARRGFMLCACARSFNI